MPSLSLLRMVAHAAVINPMELFLAYFVSEQRCLLQLMDRSHAVRLQLRKMTRNVSCPRCVVYANHY